MEIDDGADCSDPIPPKCDCCKCLMDPDEWLKDVRMHRVPLCEYCLEEVPDNYKRLPWANLD
jgi:predicted Zn-dependent protease